MSSISGSNPGEGKYFILFSIALKHTAERNTIRLSGQTEGK